MSWIRYYKFMHYILIMFIVVIVFLYSIKDFTQDYYDKGSTYTKSLFFSQAKELRRSKLEKSVLEEKRFGCKMPQLDPYAPEIMKFDNVTPKVVCDKEKDWVQCYISECRVKAEILKNMNVTCFYKDVTFLEDDFNYDVGPSVEKHGGDVYTLNISDHVRVSCKGIAYNGSTPERTWEGHKAGFRPLPKRSTSINASVSYDVLMLVFDTASHNGFLRRMPNAYRYLRDEMGAVILKGYNVVGDGSKAALFGLLAGKSELELPNARRVHLRRNKGLKLNPKDFIFHKLSKAGYRTAFFEDEPEVGAFVFKHNGFSSPPADHYLRTMLLSDLYLTRVKCAQLRELRKIYCLGGEFEHVVMLNLTAQFFEVDEKHFCFTIMSSICHDDFNMISAAEDDLLHFLRQFKSSGRLNNTLLMVMGDHGVRHNSAIRKTYQGKIEERMPFLAIVLPERLKLERPQALPSLRANVDVLSTPYDVHATVLDVVGLERDAYRIAGADMERALSLIRAVPGARSCGAASIEPAWCACARWAPVRGHMRRRVADALAAYVNLLLLPVRFKCHKRVLTSVDWVTVLHPTEEMLRFLTKADYDAYEPYLGKAAEYGSDRTYQARIVMSPGEAVFEGIVTYKILENRYIIDERSITRNSRYGDEPRCIIATHSHLDKFCYCRNYLNVKEKSFTV